MELFVTHSLLPTAKQNPLFFYLCAENEFVASPSLYLTVSAESRVAVLDSFLDRRVRPRFTRLRPFTRLSVGRNTASPPPNWKESGGDGWEGT